MFDRLLHPARLPVSTIFRLTLGLAVAALMAGLVPAQAGENADNIEGNTNVISFYEAGRTIMGTVQGNGADFAEELPGAERSPARAQSCTVYVDESASGANDGTSWSDAYLHLQDALDEANSNPSTTFDICVATGTYLPDTDKDGDHANDDSTESFTFREDNVELYGGYPSGGGTRDPAANPTVLSGDIDENDATNNDGLTISPSDISGTNSHHVVELVGDDGTPITASTRIDGVFITAGDNSFNTGGLEEGGGLLCYVSAELESNAECSPLLVRVVFQGNTAYHGGSVSFDVFEGATASPRFDNVTFRNNKAGDAGAGIGFGTGGSDTVAEPVFVNVIFSGHSERWAASFAAYNGSTLTPTFSNVTFANNSTEALRNYAQSSATHEPLIENSIFWSNSVSITDDGAATSTVNYSIVEGGWTGSGGNNLDQDPQFADPDGPDNIIGTPDDDLRLQGPGSGGGASPAIDAGDNAALLSDVTDLDGDGDTSEDTPVDRLGNARVQNGNGSSTVDMGAFESDGSALPVELASFEATQTGERTVELRWQTATERENAGFEIQHRGPAEGASWSELGSVESKATSGTTTEPQSYRYTAEDLAVGTHQFRLTQVDRGGTTHRHDPITVEVQMQGALRLSAPAPNPASGAATLRFAVREEAKTRVVLYNPLGQRVRTLYNGTPTAGEARKVRLDATGLPSGVYFLRLRAGGTVQTQRLTVVR